MCFITPPSVFLGPKPSYYIADLDLCKEIFVKHFDKFVDRLVSAYTGPLFIVIVDFICHESLYMPQVGIGFKLLWKAISISNRFLLTTSIQKRDISLLFFS